MSAARLNIVHQKRLHFYEQVARVDLTGLEDEITDFEFHFPATVPLSSETHSGADVGIFAKGEHLPTAQPLK